MSIGQKTRLNENPIAKFIGVCNDAKHELDACMRAERKRRSSANKLKADNFKASMRQLEAELKKTEETRKAA